MKTFKQLASPLVAILAGVTIVGFAIERKYTIELMRMPVHDAVGKFRTDENSREVYEVQRALQQAAEEARATSRRPLMVGALYCTVGVAELITVIAGLRRQGKKPENGSP